MMLSLTLILAATQAGPELATPPPIQDVTALEQEPNCDMPQTYNDMTHCRHLEYPMAFFELEEAWEAAMQTVARQDDPQRSAAMSRMLGEAHGAWLRFRDRHCDHLTAIEENAEEKPIVWSRCMATLTRSRSAQLRTITESIL